MQLKTVRFATCKSSIEVSTVKPQSLMLFLALSLVLTSCLDVDVDGEVELVSPVLEEVAELARMNAHQSFENYVVGIRHDDDIAAINQWMADHSHE